MAIKLELVEAPMPRRGRVAEVDTELMQGINALIGKASAEKPLSTGEVFKTKDEAAKQGTKVSRQLQSFRNDAKKRVASRTFVLAKTDPSKWNADSDRWQFGLYLAAPSKPRAKK